MSVPTAFKKLIKHAIENIHRPVGRNKHFSFILRRNQVMSIGYNDDQTTHPLGHKFGYWNCSIHSELHAILQFEPNWNELRRCVLVNIRLGKGGPKMSRPCSSCQRLLKKFQFKEIWYSDQNGNFRRM